MKKTTFLGFRATPEESEKISRLAIVYGVKKSEVLRLLVTVAEARPVQRFEPVLPDDLSAAIAKAKGEIS